MLEVEQEVHLDVFAGKFKLFFAVGICVVFFVKTLREAAAYVEPCKLDVLCDMGNAVTNLRDIGRGLI